MYLLVVVGSVGKARRNQGNGRGLSIDLEGGGWLGISEMWWGGVMRGNVIMDDLGDCEPMMPIE